MAQPWLDDGPAPWWKKLKGTSKRRTSSSSSSDASTSSTAPSSIPHDTLPKYVPFPEELRDNPYTRGERRFTVVPYSDMFLQEPHNVGRRLREMNRAHDPERHVLVDGIYEMWEDEGEWPPWEPLLLSELPAALAEICAEAELFTQVEGEADSRKPVGAALFVLRRLVKQYYKQIESKSPPDEEMRAAAGNALKAMKTIWTSIWTNRRMPTAGEYDATMCDFAVGIVLLSIEYARLHVVLYSKPFPPTDHLNHVMLHAWATAGRNRAVDSIALEILDRMHYHATRPELKTFFQEAVTDAGLTKPLAQMFRYYLLKDTSVNHRLEVIAGMLCAVSVSCPPVLHVKLPGTKTSFLQCVRIALQRQMCQTESYQHMCRILGAGLSVIKDIIEDRTESKEQPVEVLSQYVEIVETAKLIPMISRALVYSVQWRDPSLFYCLNFILQFYAGSGEFAQRSRGIYGDVARSVEEVTNVTRELFLPTLSEIREQKEAQQDIRDGAEQLWLHFGKSLGLNEKVERRRTERSTDEKPVSDNWPVWQGCRWKQCLCHGDTKCTHPMRVCKGCWRVHYCSALCQSKDWKEGGHREYCLTIRQRG